MYIMSQLEKIIKYANKTDLVSFILPKKCISGPNMIFIDHFLQLGNKETPYYGNDVEALIEDVAKAYQDAIRDFYDHGCPGV